jgi:magnesium transporter
MNGKLTAQNLNDPITGHIRKDITTLRDTETVLDAMNRLRGQELSEQIVYFYVLDDREHLVGVVPVRRLLMSNLTDRLSSLMLTRIVSVPARATVLVACELFLFYRYLALPVLDEEKRFLGVVDIGLFTDELSALAEQHEIENAFQLIGIHVTLGRKVPLWLSFKDRFPWLLVNIVGGLTCALIMSQYELLIEFVILLAMFVPVVLALAESVSMQSMTLTLQGMPDAGERTDDLLTSALKRELLVAALIGLASGAIVGGVAWLWQRDGVVAIVIGGAICLSMITACLLGVAVPSVVRRLKLNPQVAAGPIVLAIADVFALLFYFSLSGWLLERL